MSSYQGAVGVGDTGVASGWVVTRVLLGLGCHGWPRGSYRGALGLGDTGMAHGIGSY